MGKIRGKQTSVRFHCAECDERFECEPDRVEDAPEDAWHPWRYFASCPICRDEAPQDRQHRHLFKMWASSTGPRTEEGKAATAKNLEGHPTPEEARRTRFNALKHGMSAQTATYWPARPGQYPHCRGCEYLDNVCGVREKACLKRTELLLKHHIAFEAGDPSMLTSLRAQLHGNVQALIDDMILALAQDGVRLKTPEWYYDKDGHFHWARGLDEDGRMIQLHKIEQHPLLRTLGDLISKLDLGLGDMGMTPKAIEDNDAIRGHLGSEAQRSEQSLDFQRRQVEVLENLGDLIKRSRTQSEQDPVLLEHKQSGDG